MQNGGKYSAELTKRCSHLVCDISCLFVVLDIKLPTCMVVFAILALSDLSSEF